MNEQLWNADTGVFGEVKERFGYGRLNAAPDLSSIYTPVDMGIATDEQVYQMNEIYRLLLFRVLQT